MQIQTEKKNTLTCRNRRGAQEGGHSLTSRLTCGLVSVGLWPACSWGAIGERVAPPAARVPRSRLGSSGHAHAPARSPLPPAGARSLRDSRRMPRRADGSSPALERLASRSKPPPEWPETSRAHALTSSTSTRFACRSLGFVSPLQTCGCRHRVAEWGRRESWNQVDGSL